MVNNTAGAARWYAIQVERYREPLVRDQLVREGFGCLYPTFTRIRRVRLSDVPVVLPLMPGYLFVEFDARQQAWRGISRMRGVTRILGQDAERPTPIGPAEAERLLAGFGSGPLPVEAPAVPWHTGDRVRISSGVFADFAAVCCLPDSTRTKVMLRWLGRDQEVWLDNRQIERAE